jgi:2-keto-4-pentenoate hydratase
MSNQKIQHAAEIIRKAYDTGQPCEPIRDSLHDSSLDTAYAVQVCNTEYWLEQGRCLVGRKIGLTSKAVQQQLGVDQPDYGMLYADMCRGDGEEINFGDVLQTKIEAEIVFVLEKDLDKEINTTADLIGAIAYALPALEIVGSRVANWDITIVDTIADNASSGLFVLGTSPRKLDQIDLRLCGMVMERFGDQVSVGAGAACLGNPLNAAVWLANVMAKTNYPLRAGDIILSGALAPMVQVNPGDVFEARISGLGSVRAAFSGEAS